MTTRSIAILIDGGFFLKRLPKLVPANRCETPERIAVCIRRMCQSHVRALTGCDLKTWNQHVYRIFYYDALPYEGKSHHPVDNRPIDFSKTEVAKQRLALFDCLKRQRKFALRLGKVNLEHDWLIRPEFSKKLLRSRAAMSALDNPVQTTDERGNASITFTADQYRHLTVFKELWQQLDANSVHLGLRQKGVDMRIGIDIAALSLKKQVSTIVLVSGDSDFVPAAKLARREGVDFVLDPLWQKVNADLFEHIDGLQSGLPKPGQGNNGQNLTPDTTTVPNAD